MVNYQKTKSSVSYFPKLIVTEIEARRKEGRKYIKILLMRWDILMGKIHRVWRRDNKLHFHVSILFIKLFRRGV